MESIKEIYRPHTAAAFKSRPPFNPPLRVGILHTAYMQQAGEDAVANAEYQLLQSADNIVVNQYRLKNPKSKWKQILQYLQSPFNIVSFLKVYTWLRQERIQVLHVHNWHFAASPGIFWAARLAHVPIVHTLHNYRLLCPSGTLFENGKLFTASLNGKFPWEAVRRKVYRNSTLQTFLLACTVWLHRRLGTWKKIDRYICLTPFQRSLMLDTGLGISSGQVSVKTNFVNGISAGKINDRKGQKLVFAGRLSEEKGVRILLQMIPRLQQPLEIIGTGPMENEVREAAASNPLVTCSGFRDRDYIIHALQHAQALIFPSLWYEGMPMILAESLAAATPVIASRLGAMPGIISENRNGFLFDAGDASELEAAIARWNQLDEHDKSAMRREARLAYESYYTPEKNLEVLLDIYKDLISQKTQIHST